MSADEEIPEIAGFVDLRLIGRGGTAMVYSATQTTMHRRVAVKVVEATGAQARRFEREVLALGAMSDIPHVVQVHSVEFTTDGRPVLVMPLMPNSLGGLLHTGGACTIEQVLKWAGQLAVAVDEAHRRGIFHRDIKPENVLISGFDDAYLADFGIATLEDMAAATMTRMSLSPPYAPPERYTGSADAPIAGDVYSLAATLYAALAGRPPFGTTADGGLQGLVTRITSNAPPPISGVTPAVQAVLTHGLAKQPARRPATALALLEELVAAAGAAPTPPPPPPPPPSGGAGPRDGPDDETRPFDATRAYDPGSSGDRTGRGANRQVGVFLTAAEARAGGVQAVRVIDPAAGDRPQPEMQVRVPPGVHNGQRLRIPGRGATGSGSEPPGDLFVLVHIDGESPFARRGNDLTITVPVAARDLERGSDIKVGTIHGNLLTIRVPPRTDSGRVVRVAGAGLASQFGRGELLVTLVALDDRTSPESPTARPSKSARTRRIRRGTASAGGMETAAFSWRRVAIGVIVPTLIAVGAVLGLVALTDDPSNSTRKACAAERSVIMTAIEAYRAMDADGRYPTSYAQLMAANGALLDQDPSARFPFPVAVPGSTPTVSGVGECAGTS